MNIFKKILFIAAVFLLYFPALYAVPKTAHFWISNLENDRFKSKQFQAPIVISFFFVDCIPCKKEVPQLFQLITRNYPDVKLLFIDPIQEDDKSRIAEFARRWKVPRRFFYHDPLGAIARKFDIDGRFPTIIGIRNREQLFRLNDLSEKSIQKIKSKLK